MFCVVRDRDRTIYRSLYGKIEYQQWWGMNNDEDDGSILEVHYLKEYSDTGLRLTASGDHRTWFHNGLSYCAKW